MTTFKVTERQNTHYGHEYPEYTKFARYDTGLIVWVPLLVGENKVQSFALSNLTEVKPQRNTVTAVDMGYEFGCAIPPRAIVLWQPTLILTPDLAANINASAGVVIKVVPPVTLWHPALKAVA